MLIVASCSSGSSSSDDLVVQDGDSIEVHYVLTLDDGSVVDSSRDRGEPLPFVVGSGEVISGFDDAVRGTKVGDILDTTLEPEDAYGAYDPTLIADVPIAEGQEDVAVGDTVYLSNGQAVVVVAIADGVATVDTNHKLAGQTLHFEVEIVSVTRG
jgi:FKBP-type peptidyl-prolyl cis-trans isomerase 2